MLLNQENLQQTKSNIKNIDRQEVDKAYNHKSPTLNVIYRMLNNIFKFLNDFINVLVMYIQGSHC